MPLLRRRFCNATNNRARQMCCHVAAEAFPKVAPHGSHVHVLDAAAANASARRQRRAIGRRRRRATTTTTMMMTMKKTKSLARICLVLSTCEKQRTNRRVERIPVAPLGRWIHGKFHQGKDIPGAHSKTAHGEAGGVVRSHQQRPPPAPLPTTRTDSLLVVTLHVHESTAG